MSKSIFRESNKTGAKNYTPISNKILQSTELTFDETSLLVYLLSLPEKFKIIQKNVLKTCKDRISKGRFENAWKGLVNKGYIVKINLPTKNNLKRVGWKVFENPKSRESQIQKTRDLPSLESKQVESNNIKSNNIENNNINNIENYNTRSSILEKKEIFLRLCFEEARKESVQFLTGATILGEDILLYSNYDQRDELLDRIGNVQFDIIKEQLEKLNYVTKQLNEINSSSTEGLSS